MVEDFHGAFVDCSDLTCDPKPLPQRHPPIWLDRIDQIASDIMPN